MPGSSNTTFTVYNGNESTTQTDFTQSLTRGGINIVTDFTDQAYTPGIFWSTQNNSPTKPKAGIYLHEDGNFGTSMLFGTSGAYSTGITNTALELGPSGNAKFKNGADSPTGFQVQNSSGAGLLTVNTATGATITSTLFIDTLGSGGSTVLCWNGSSQVSTCSGTGSPFIQGGNSFGTAGILGTNDNQNLQFETNGSTVATLTTAGQLQMSVQGSAGGLLIGGDANLYRYLSGVLVTDGELNARSYQCSQYETSDQVCVGLLVLQLLGQVLLLAHLMTPTSTEAGQILLQQTTISCSMVVI